MMLINAVTETVVAQQVELAITFWQRLRGLAGRRAMPPGSAMLLYPCNSVHTCFMRFPIDIIFSDQQGHVLKIVHNLPPFRFTSPVKDSRLVLELPAGQAAATGIMVNHKIKFALNRGEG